jgi:hypothetical protein
MNFSDVGYDPSTRLYVLKDNGAKYYIDFNMLQVYKDYRHSGGALPNQWYTDMCKADRKKVKKVEYDAD